MRADTGDDFPDAYDAVVMIEKAAIQPDGSVVLDDDVQVEPGTSVRPGRVDTMQSRHAAA